MRVNTGTSGRTIRLAPPGAACRTWTGQTRPAVSDTDGTTWFLLGLETELFGSAPADEKKGH